MNIDDKVVVVTGAASGIGRAAALRFALVLPHPEVLQYFRAKADDYERWLGGMQKLYLRTRS